MLKYIYKDIVDDSVEKIVIHTKDRVEIKCKFRNVLREVKKKD